MKYLLITIVIFILCGCEVPSEVWKTAERVCGANGGVESVSVDITLKWTAVCNNGGVFTIDLEDIPND